MVVVAGSAAHPVRNLVGDSSRSATVMVCRGDVHAITERDTTYGYVQPKLDYNEHDGVDPGARFRAKFNLPLAERRFSALLGRSDREDEEREERKRSRASSGSVS
jgi:hypothetical protein